jgi:hypothetical protein
MDAKFLLLIIFAGMVIHTPFMVVMATLFPESSLIFKSWKEVLLIILVGLTVVSVFHDSSYSRFMRDKVILVTVAYCLLHVLSAMVLFHEPLSVISGLMIDLRYIVFFLVVYVWLSRYPPLRRPILKVVAGGAVLVFGFAIAQVFILPYDILSYVGYNKDTIIPYLLVDNNYEFIRINSTLRGPNPLGAYAAMIISILIAYVITREKPKRRRDYIPFFILIGAMITLWASYSRSALIGACIGLGFIMSLKFIPLLKRSKRITLGVILILVVMVGVVTSNANSQFISHILLHQNPNSNHLSRTNIEHVESLKDGSSRMINQPLGAGVGTTGSASLFTDNPLIIENQYLFVAHETGWLGLVVFIILIFIIFKRLWLKRADWLCLGVLGAGVALSLIGLLLPVWSDDTVSMIWWGLAGLASASYRHIEAVSS